jgi:hypothetical protein
MSKIINYLISENIDDNIYSKFHKIKNKKQEINDIIDDNIHYTIILSNSMNTRSISKFLIDKNKYLNKIISIIIICENNINNLIDNIQITDDNEITDIVIYINEYIYKDNINRIMFKEKVNDLIAKNQLINYIIYY